MPGRNTAATATSFAALCSHISHDNVAELKEAFSVLDSNGSGTATSEEIRLLFSSIMPNMTDADYNTLIDECRVDRTEPITFAQFFVLVITLTAKAKFGSTGAFFSDDVSALYAAFAPFDPDESGFVDSSVFLYLMGEKGDQLSPQELVGLRLRLERTGFMKRGRVNYKGFLNNLLSTSATKQIL